MSDQRYISTSSRPVVARAKPRPSNLNVHNPDSSLIGTGPLLSPSVTATSDNELLHVIQRRALQASDFYKNVGLSNGDLPKSSKIPPNTPSKYGAKWVKPVKTPVHSGAANFTLPHQKSESWGLPATQQHQFQRSKSVEYSITGDTSKLSVAPHPDDDRNTGCNFKSSGNNIPYAKTYSDMNTLEYDSPNTKKVKKLKVTNHASNSLYSENDLKENNAGYKFSEERPIQAGSLLADSSALSKEIHQVTIEVSDVDSQVRSRTSTGRSLKRTQHSLSYNGEYDLVIDSPQHPLQQGSRMSASLDDLIGTKNDHSTSLDLLSSPESSPSSAKKVIICNYMILLWTLGTFF